MGPNFPVNKKLNLSQALASLKQAQQSAGGSGAIGNPKPAFNMFMPIMFVAHAHMNGAVLLQSSGGSGSSDYEKTLLDAYMPFLTFFDWLCKTIMNRFSQQQKQK